MADIYTKLYQQTCHAFGEAGTKRLAECKLNIEASATHTLKGMDLAQYFLVAPLIDALLEHLPKPVAKEVFKRLAKALETRRRNTSTATETRRKMFSMLSLPGTGRSFGNLVFQKNNSKSTAVKPLIKRR